MMSLNWLVSGIQDYIEYIIKQLKHYPLIYFFIFIFLFFSLFIFSKMKDGYKLEFQTPENMKLFGSTKNYRQRKRMEKMHGVVKLLNQVQYNAIQQTINLTKVYGVTYLYIHMFLKTYNTVFDDITITFMDHKNGTPL